MSPDEFVVEIRADVSRFERELWRAGYILSRNRAQPSDPNPFPRFRLWGRR
jgi:hypothetical protein